MTEEQTALARRAVACRGWKWLPGMLASDGVSVAFRLLHDGERLVMAPNVPGWDAVEVPAQVPDHLCPVFSDAATLGCLSDLVTEAYADPKKLWNGYVEVHRDVLDVFCLEQAARDEDGDLVWNCICSGETEVEVLVRALEIAP